MDLKGIKVGYVPYLPDLSQPADRRRFPFFAESNDISFEIADPKKVYDIVLLTAPANLSLWLDYKKKYPATKFIFEMVDSLILPSDSFTNLFQGIGRFLIGKEKHISLTFRKVLIEWIKVADAVICSSTKMKRIIERWNNNVFVSLDYMQNEVKYRKVNYETGTTLKLVWEGQGVVAKHLLAFRDVFENINSFCELHVITDPVYPSHGNLIHHEIHRLLNQLPIKCTFHPWEMFKNYELLISCDCGIIPINNGNKMAWHKPANKLISFWFAGLPTLVSDTPAYVEMMDKAHCHMYCRNSDEWVLKIKEFANLSGEQRKIIADANLRFAERNYSNKMITAQWREIFNILQKATG